MVNLLWISLNGNGISERGVDALAASPFLEQVRFLGLRDNPADPTPAVNDYEGIYYVQVPDLAAELVGRFGERPWLTVGEPEHWPPHREGLAITD